MHRKRDWGCGERGGTGAGASRMLELRDKVGGEREGQLMV